MQSSSNPYIASLIVGLLQGLSYCGFLCLPYLATYVAGIEGGFRKGLAVALIFGLGRTTAYGLLGGLTGVLKGFLRDLVYQKYVSIGFGIVIMLIGTTIILRKKSICIPEKRRFSTQISTKFKQYFDFRAFSLGFTRGLVPCPPLFVILLYSAAFHSLIECVVLAVLFGLGTLVSPLLLFGGATRWLINKLPRYEGWISKISGGILLLMGVEVLISALLSP